jgi:2'-hydroxyisoflavone reductase
VKLLVIGGTRFIGVHVVRHALEAGHEVTIFHRGLTNPDAFPPVERLIGDRAQVEDLEPLRKRDWDAVVDTCGYDHRVVERSSEVLTGRVGHYTFVSSVAVYADFSRPNAEEDPKAELDCDLDSMGESLPSSLTLYGPMKVRCEEVIARAFPDRSLVVRPTAVSGPLDHGASNRRIAYWAARMRDYDVVLAPRPRNRLVSYIDVRDLAAWMVDRAISGTTGVFNAAAPPLAFERFLGIARDLYGSAARVVWADPDWLLQQGVKPNAELPWWVPSEPCLFAVDVRRALASGLVIRPIEETIQDSVEWEDARPTTVSPSSPFADKAGGALMERARELELLERWRARVGAAAIG